MKRIALIGIVGSVLIFSCAPTVEEEEAKKKKAYDPCKDPKAALSNYLLEKCYGKYLEQINVNKEDIEKLKKRIAKVEEGIEGVKGDVASLKEDIGKIKITGKEQVRIYFDFDRFYLREDAKQALDELINAVRDKDIKKVFVIGYASKPGTRGYNLGLSEKRAQVVGAYLIKNGIPVEKIVITSYGEELADIIGEREPEQRAVDVIVLY